MKLAIVTDSTCDIRKAELDELNALRVPLYVNFKGEVFKDWVEISPQDLVEGVAGGADLPSTSQPSPQDFAETYKEAVAAGAEEIICITISSGLSGTYQSANIAAKDADVPVTVFDSQHASIGVGSLVKHASKMRSEGATLAEIMTALEHIRETNKLLFVVGGLEYLQKNGRIGGAQAMMGSLLNIKPILTINDGKVDAEGRARGTKKALKEVVAKAKAYAENHPRRLKVSFLHIQDEAAGLKMREELQKSGLEYDDMGIYEIGAVISSHVGPGTFGMYMHTEPDA